MNADNPERGPERRELCYGYRELLTRRLADSGWRVFAGVRGAQAKAMFDELRHERITPLILDVS